MIVEGLTIPSELVGLIEAGRWPANKEGARLQLNEPIVPGDRLAAFDDRSIGLFLYPPPFATVSRFIDEGDELWLSPMVAPGELDHDLTVPIGDFGIGFDSPVVLDYRADRSNPSVLYLRWSPPPRESLWKRLRQSLGTPPLMRNKFDNHWTPLAATFGEFARIAGLIECGHEP